MSIKNTWDEINESQDDDLTSLLNTSRLSGISSRNPLEKIRKNLLLNMILGVLICLVYVVVIFYFQIWQVQLCTVLVLLFSVWALYTAWLQYKNINSTVSANSPVLDELKRHYRSINNWMNTQQRVALFFYPVSAMGGFMLGGVSESGKSVADFMSKPMVWVALIVALAILVPACWYLTRWMFKYSFGKHLRSLKENIDALETAF
ncbi:MAG: hypothetical protein IPQ08_10980 [Chitinophagaceae bacterium]|nr:hypothetical protein [Chitinophagaceae bacterium]